jgi:Tol biopolymer transport system component
MRRLAGTLGLILAAAAPAAAQAPLPAPPQVASLDSEAPPGAPPHWLPGEKWVMQHWLPYDEARLYELLGVDRGDVWRWLRDDTRTLADLARENGWDPADLARELVAPFNPALAGRALRTLTQGHLSQHIYFHSLHQNAIPDNARKVFGVASREQFQAARRAELSPVEICRLHGVPGAEAARRAEATLRSMAAEGVRTRQIPAAQAERLLARQLSQLPRWLGQTRYNGPPPLQNPRASEATASNFSNNAVLSADGRHVAWEVYESKLALAKTRGEINVFARALDGAEPVQVSVADIDAGGVRSSYNPAISSSGRYVAYESAAGNLNFAKRYGRMAVYVRDTVRGATVAASTVNRSAFNPAISGDGRTFAFETWGGTWVARRGGASRLLHPSLLGIGRPGEPALSADGNFVAFTATVPGAVGSQVYRHDLRTGRTRLVSDGTGEAFEPVLSATGRFVAYTQLSGGRSRVLRADLRTGATRLVANHAGQPAIDAAGDAVAYTRRGANSTVWVNRELVSRAATPAMGDSEHPSISADGRYVTFTSDAWNLTGSKCNAARGVFVRDRVAKTTALLSVGDGANRYLGPTRGSSAAGDMTVALVCA